MGSMGSRVRGLALFGCIWPYLAVLPSIWPYLALLGPIWLYYPLFGPFTLFPGVLGLGCQMARYRGARAQGTGLNSRIDPKP